MTHKRLSWVFIALLLLLLTTVANYLIFLKIPSYESVESYLDKRLQALHVEAGKDGQNGYTPIKGVDYFDGKDGKDGRDGADGQQGLQGEKGETGAKGETGDKGDIGDAGKTPEIRCNVNKNVWQVRYSEEENWRTLGDSPVKCVIT